MNRPIQATHSIALLPFAVFVGLFLTSAIFFNSALSPLFTCLLAITVSFFTFKENLSINRKVEIGIEGSAQPTVLAMCYIFIFSAVFSYTLKLIGGLDAAVNLGLYIIPNNFILPGFFIIVSLFATAIGTSMGAIAAFVPIGMGIAHQLGVDPALMAGVVVSGAMLGDNLSIISDTTIAATQTTGARMKDKFRINLRLVAPAFFLTIITLFIINQYSSPDSTLLTLTTLNLNDIITTLPYMLIFLFALLGLDVIAVLIIGTSVAVAIGIWQGTFDITRGTGIILEGFVKDSSGIQEVLILSLLVAALSHIVAYNGGIEYLLTHMRKRIHTKGGAELYISILVFLVNAAVAINTIAILVTGPVAKKIGDSFDIAKSRVASLIDIVACVCQGILPYAPQLLLAGSLAGVSSIAIIPHLHYQGYILLVVIGSIVQTYIKN
ncbi:MAG TPA: Na+/H+ antiporter NhaC family protein [Candidatus Dependentiae bacterium]|nr:Na+/H+ antiporter NhaC family protein [Candidatus Dependentiae bacterium]HRQ62987.1 Na+/H+ antiporter NhaC family protein [Candidatus Dependentiae bacterium]